MSMNKEVLGVCSKCGNTGVMPNIGDMTASECELCSMDYETLKQVRGTDVADFSMFLGSVAEFKEAFTEGHIYTLISPIILGAETSEVTVDDFYLEAFKLNNGQIAVSIRVEIWGQQILVHTFRTRVWSKDGVLISRNRVLERTRKKALSWEPGYAHLSLISALNTAHHFRVQNVEMRCREDLNNQSSGFSSIFTSIFSRFLRAIGLKH